MLYLLILHLSIRLLQVLLVQLPLHCFEESDLLVNHAQNRHVVALLFIQVHLFEFEIKYLHEVLFLV